MLLLCLLHLLRLLPGLQLVEERAAFDELRVGGIRVWQANHHHASEHACNARTRMQCTHTHPHARGSRQEATGEARFQLSA